MKCKRLNEVLELLQPYWSKDPDLSLLQILQKIADEAGFDKPVAELSDEIIIYQGSQGNTPSGQGHGWQITN